jgi:hypothetical protein
VAFVGMTFMLSQAFSMVAIDGQDSEATYSALGLNPLPLVVMLGILASMGLLIAGLSLRRADLASTTSDGRRAGNPLVFKKGSCSVVVSARCHRAERDGHDVAIRPVAFGIVQGSAEAKVGHATFSSQPVDALTVGKAYV